MERLIHFVQDGVLSEKGGGGDQDVSNELKLLTSLIVSAPSLRLNQNGKSFCSALFLWLSQAEPISSLDAIASQPAVFQERKRKELHIKDAVITIATTYRREKVLLTTEDAPVNESYSRGFRGSLIFKSKAKKKMLTVSVQQGQVLFNRFTSLLPRVIVCNILPNNSPVFEVASEGSVEDLMRLIVENKASLDDHDENGWSLLHVSTQ
jgi:hypothetical protein